MKRELENNSNDDDDDDNDNKIAEVSAILEGGVGWGGGGRNSLHDYTEMCHLTVLKPVIWFYQGERVVDGV